MCNQESISSVCVDCVRYSASISAIIHLSVQHVSKKSHFILFLDSPVVAAEAQQDD